MIRTVAVVFGVLAIALMVLAFVYVAAKFTDWLARRQQVKRLLGACRKEERKP